MRGGSGSGAGRVDVRTNGEVTVQEEETAGSPLTDLRSERGANSRIRTNSVGPSEAVSRPIAESYPGYWFVISIRNGAKSKLLSLLAPFVLSASELNSGAGVVAVKISCLSKSLTLALNAVLSAHGVTACVLFLP